MIASCFLARIFLASRGRKIQGKIIREPASRQGAPLQSGQIPYRPRCARTSRRFALYTGNSRGKMVGTWGVILARFRARVRIAMGRVGEMETGGERGGGMAELSGSALPFLRLTSRKTPLVIHELIALTAAAASRIDAASGR